MNKKNFLRISIAAGATVVIATALFVNAAVGSPSAAGKNRSDASSGPTAASDSKSSSSEQSAAVSSTTDQSAAVSSTKDQSAAASSASTEPTFTLKQLAAYNGKNGQPAYVAYKGIVYDLTAVSNWSSGKHHGISAGTDVTEVFSASPHAVSILKMGFVVGKLVSESAAAVSSNDAGSPAAIGTTVSVSGVSAGSAANSGTTLKVFTKADLATYDASGGKPAYVAYKGIVYDLTAVGTWSNGMHHGVSAGTDITARFSSSPHAASILSMGFVVGTMEGFTGTMPVQAASSQSGTSIISGSNGEQYGESDANQGDDRDEDSDSEVWDD